MPIYASMVSIALELCTNGDPLSYTLPTLNVLLSLLFVCFVLLPLLFLLKRMKIHSSIELTLECYDNDS